MAFHVAFGFDCDAPRGIEYVRKEKGQEMLADAVEGLRLISRQFQLLEIPRTYFICGEYLESLVDSIGLSKQ